MLLEATALAKHLRSAETSSLRIVPTPDLTALEASGAASVDLRLGRWFVTFRHARSTVLDVVDRTEAPAHESRITKSHYVPFGEKFYLHPGNFILGSTLEWLQLPAGLGGFVGGKSSWGRRGLIIETAAGIHPGFTGCLTLEISNLGEIPIAIVPGMPICQVVFHKTTENGGKNFSSFNGKRKPVLGQIKIDATLKKLLKKTRPKP